MLSRIVLIYAMPEEKRDAAAETLKAAGLPVLFIGRERDGLSLRSVLEPGSAEAAGDGIDETFAVLHGFKAERVFFASDEKDGQTQSIERFRRRVPLILRHRVYEHYS